MHILLMEHLTKKALTKEILDFLRHSNLYNDFVHFMTDKGYTEEEVDEITHQLQQR